LPINNFTSIRVRFPFLPAVSGQKNNSCHPYNRDGSTFRQA
jgi:hypothetical protein